MVTDNQTNAVFLAEGLGHYMPMCINLLNALENEGIPMFFLPRTESEYHVWARDYMPIQLDTNVFLQYKYYPDYLLNYSYYIPEYQKISKDLGLRCYRTNIILDGGNVIKCGDKAILTDKVFRENPDIPKEKLISKLELLLNAEVVFIPWDRHEMFGHADGMVRYIKGDTVLINNYVDYDPYFRTKLIDALSGHFKVEELCYHSPRCSSMSWAYLNFLQVKKCIFVPGLRTKEDPMAIRQIQDFYPDHQVIRIDNCQDLVRDGGALNCISWNLSLVFTKDKNEELKPWKSILTK